MSFQARGEDAMRLASVDSSYSFPNPNDLTYANLVMDRLKGDGLIESVPVGAPTQGGGVLITSARLQYELNMAYEMGKAERLLSPLDQPMQPHAPTMGHACSCGHKLDHRVHRDFIPADEPDDGVGAPEAAPYPPISALLNGRSIQADEYGTGLTAAAYPPIPAAVIQSVIEDEFPGEDTIPGPAETAVCGAVNPRTGWVCDSHTFTKHRMFVPSMQDYYDWLDD